MSKKGIVLCGGKGTRMLPATKVMNKHMIPILNKPMVLYPIETLARMGFTDILLISGGNHIGGFADFLGDGSEYGVSFTYKVQKEAGGIAQALLLAENFVDERQFAVILGDNYFEIPPKVPEEDMCGLVTKYVEDLRRFGVLHQNGEGEKWIEEKPEKLLQYDSAVTGLYFYTSIIFNFIKNLGPSQRGEVEITDVNNWCLKNVPTYIQTCQGFWSDMGTPESMLATIKHLHG